MPCHGMLKKLLFHQPIGSIESTFGAQNTWPEHNKGVAPIPHPMRLVPWEQELLLILWLVTLFLSLKGCKLFNWDLERQASHRTSLRLIARSLVSANRWLRGIKMCRFPWYLTLVSTNRASSNPGLPARRDTIAFLLKIVAKVSTFG